MIAFILTLVKANNFNFMFATNGVIRAFANISPHLKAIHALGINSRSIVFNPRFCSSYLAFLSYMKLHSKNKNHLIRIQGLPE